MTVHTNEIVDVFSIGNRDATIARVDFTLVNLGSENLSFAAEGTAKRDPIDDHDEEVAQLLAYGRAFEALGKKMQKLANSKTKHNDDVRTYRERQLERRLTPGKNVKKLPKKNAGRKAKVAASK